MSAMQSTTSNGRAAHHHREQQSLLTNFMDADTTFPMQEEANPQDDIDLDGHLDGGILQYEFQMSTSLGLGETVDQHISSLMRLMDTLDETMN